MNSQRSIWPSLVIVILVAILGGAIRCLFASQELLWLDELHTSWVVNASLGEVHDRASIGNQTPLYFWLTWIPTQLIGQSEFSLRLVSLIASVGTMAVSGWIVLKWTGSTQAAALATILIALNTQFIYYGSEARPYALVQFLGTVQVILFWQAFKPLLSFKRESSSASAHIRLPAWRLAIVSALLFYSHYTSVWVFIPEFIFVGIWIMIDFKIRKQFWFRLSSTTLLTFVLCIPALLQLKALFARRGNWASVSSMQGVIDNMVMPFGLWIAIPFVVVLVSPRKSNEPTAPAQSDETLPKPSIDMRYLQALFVFLWAIIPIAGVIGLEYFDVAPIALTRYTLVGAVAFPIFAGLMLGLIKKRKTRIGMAAGLIAISLVYSPLSSPDIFSGDIRGSHSTRMRFEDWKSPVDEINFDQNKKSQPVFLASNLIEDVDAFKNLAPDFQEYLLFPIKNLHSVNEGDGRELIAIPTLNIEHFQPAHIKSIQEQGGAWVIVRGAQSLAIEIENEIVRKSKELFPNAKGMKTTHFRSASSGVYLLSLDW